MRPPPILSQVKIERPVLRIPTLAIHLTKSDERSAFKPNLQTNFYPILATELKANLGKRAGTANGAGESKGHDQGQNGHKGIAKPERHHSVLVEMLAEELGWVCVLVGLDWTLSCVFNLFSLDTCG